MQLKWEIRKKMGFIDNKKGYIAVIGWLESCGGGLDRPVGFCSMLIIILIYTW